MLILTGAFGLQFDAFLPMVLNWGFLNTEVPLTALDDIDYQSDRISPSHLLKDGL
jgi:hypothetical protein